MQFFLHLRRLGELWRNERGNTLILTALALPVIIGAAGIGVHVMQLSLTKRELQREADSAAMAGAYSLYQSQGNTAATAAANKALTQNNLVQNVTSTITPGSYTNSSGTTYTSSMYVKVSGTIATPLMALLGRSSSGVAAEARAATVAEGSFCFFASEDQVATGVKFQGNTTVNLGCGVGTNAKGSSPVIASGSALVTASPVAAMGTVSASTNYSAGTVLMSNHSQITNPFTGRSFDPSTNDVPSCKSGNNWNVIDVPSGTSATLGTLGGSACYGTINVQGNLTLQSGTYYLANGANNAGLQIGAQGHLTCDKCTFILTSTNPNSNQASFATMNINAGAELDLTPPDTGTYKGLTIYRDSRAAASNQCCTINGNSNSSLSGAFYFPNDELTFNGTSGMDVKCFQMVAKRLKFTGDSNIINTCKPEDVVGGNWKLDKVRLIN